VGDYVAVDPLGNRLILRALDGSQSTWPWRFNDTFKGCPIVDVCSDTFSRVYTPVISDGGCTFNRDSLLMIGAPAGPAPQACGLMTARPALNFFADPIVHRFGNISAVLDASGAAGGARFALLALNASVGYQASAEAVLASGPALPGGSHQAGPAVAAVGVDVLVGAGAPTVVTWQRPPEPGAATRVVATSPVPAACVSANGSVAGLSLELRLDSSNASTATFCGGVPGQSGGGHHHLKWQEWGAAGALGRSRLAMTVVADGAAGAKVALGSYSAATQLPDRVLPAVLEPYTDGAMVDAAAASLGDAHSLNASARGIVDVTLPPFNAPRDGVADATLPLNAAIAWGRAAGLVTFLPAGTYAVSGTLQVVQFGRAAAGATVTPDGLIVGEAPGRAAPASLRGQADPSRPGERAVIRLLPSAPGFASASSPRPVLNVSCDVAATTEEREHLQPNVNMNQVVMALDVEVPPGMRGAVGVRLRAAQGSGLEDVTVRAGDGLFGVSGLPGSGGANVGLTVVGGRWGIDARGTQPQSTVTGLRLSGQACAAIVLHGMQSVTLVAANVTRDAASPGARGGIPAVVQACDVAAAVGSDAGGECPTPVGDDWCDEAVAYQGQLTVVDSIVDAGNGSAVWTRRTAAARNLWVRGASTVLVAATEGASPAHPLRFAVPPAAGPPSGWTHLRDAVVPVEPPPMDWNRSKDPARMLNVTFLTSSLALSSPGAWNRTFAPTVDAVASAAGPPPGLLTSHGWGAAEAFPSFEWPGAVLAKVAGPGRTAAAGDGTTDDAGAIQAAIDEACGAGTGAGVVMLGRGVFAVSRGLSVPPGCALIGASSWSTHVVPMPSLGRGGAAASTGNWVITASAGTRAGPSAPGAPAGVPTTVGMLQVRLWHETAAWGSGIRVLMAASDTGPLGTLRGGTRRQGVANAAAAPPVGFRHRQATVWTQYLCRDGAVRPGGAPCDAAPQLSVLPLLWLTGAASGDERAASPAWSAELFTVFFGDTGHEAPSYRHVLLSGLGAASEVRFYHLNTEHATGEANTQVDACAGTVLIYGLKSEGQFPVLWVSAAPAGSAVAMFGYGGNACPFAYNSSYPAGYAQFVPSLFRITVSAPGTVQLLNTLGFEMPDTLALGNRQVGCEPPTRTSTVVVNTVNGVSLRSEPLERPAVVRV